MAYNADFNDTTFKAVDETPKKKYSIGKKDERTALQKVVITSANIAGIASAIVLGYNLVEFGACCVVPGYSWMDGINELVYSAAAAFVLKKTTPTIVKNSPYLSAKWEQVKDVTSTWKEMREGSGKSR